MKTFALLIFLFASTTNSQGSLPTRELPRVMNAPVMHHLYVSLESEHSRTKMREMLVRMKDFRPMIESKLAEAGLPRELVVIPVVESMYRADAISPREAAGLWQLVPETARQFGLKVDDTVDERLDAEKATTAALAYLKSIHGRTNDWSLTLLSYNMGESRVRKLIKRTGVRDVFKLVRERHLKDEESSNYVSKVMAALIVIDHPELVSN